MAGILASAHSYTRWQPNNNNVLAAAHDPALPPPLHMSGLGPPQHQQPPDAGAGILVNGHEHGGGKHAGHHVAFLSPAVSPRGERADSRQIEDMHRDGDDALPVVDPTRSRQTVVSSEPNPTATAEGNLGEASTRTGPFAPSSASATSATATTLNTLPLIAPGNGGALVWCARWFMRKPASHPGTFACVILGLVSIFVGVGISTLPLKIETSFDSFLKTDVYSSITRDAFKQALSERSAVFNRRLQEAKPSPSPPAAGVTYTDVDLFLAYELRDAETEDARLTNAIFHPRVLGEVASFERRLRELPGWQRFCGLVETRHQPLCDPGVTFASYMYPTIVGTREDLVTPKTLSFDGNGRDMVPFAAALHLAETHGLHTLFFPSDAGNATSIDKTPVHYLRSIFRFKIPSAVGPRSYAQAEWDRFCVEELVEEIRLGTKGEGSELETSLVRVFFAGTGVEDFEVREALSGDLTLAAGSASFVLGYLLFHTRSLLLSVLGLLITILAVPLAYVLSAVIVGSNTVSFASFLALFLVVGFGCDVIFVYTDAWRDSKQQVDSDADRLAWTWRRAGKASFATTATTALSFFANLASAIRALRQFGFFMGFNVMLAWALISVIYTPLCLFDERLRKLLLPPLRRCSSEVVAWIAAYVAAKDEQEKVDAADTLTAKLNDAKGSEAKANEGTKSCGKDTKVRRRSFSHRMALRCLACHRSNLFEDGFRLRFFALWAHHLRRWRFCYIVLPIVASVCAMYMCMQMAKPGVGVPSIFPDGHNRYRGQAVFGRFESVNAVMKPSFMLPDPKQELCRGDDIPVSAMQCQLYWCNAYRHASEDDSLPDGGNANGGSKNCRCWRRSRLCADGTQEHYVSRSIVGASWTERGLESYWDAMEGFVPAHFVYSEHETRMLNPVLMQEWETGDSVLSPQGRVIATYTQNSSFGPDGQTGLPASSRFCGTDEVCFCGRLECTLNTRVWSQTKDIVVDSSSQPAAMLDPPDGLGRRLALKLTVPATLRAKIRVVLGLWVATQVPLLGTAESATESWGFLGGFRLDMPWSQRSILKLCLEVPKELRVDYQWCWVDKFREWLYRREELYPVVSSRFTPLVQEFLQENPAWTQYLWVKDNQVRGYYISFRADVHKDKTPTDKMKAYKEMWDDFVQGWNAEAASTASGAFHVCDSWVEPEVQAELISSTLATLLLLVVLAFFGMLVFTTSIALSLFVVASTILVVVGLAFFIVVVMQWSVGLIEVIAIIYFIGYAVTYSLHIAHMFGANAAEEPGGVLPGCVDWRPLGRCNGQSARRFLRVSFSLQSIGGAALGSAATTAGSSAFLVLCTLSVFRKLGCMCLAVTLLSIMVALGPLPAALLTFGPARPGRAYGCIRRFFGMIGNHQEEIVRTSKKWGWSFTTTIGLKRQTSAAERWALKGASMAGIRGGVTHNGTTVRE